MWDIHGPLTWFVGVGAESVECRYVLVFIVLRRFDRCWVDPLSNFVLVLGTHCLKLELVIFVTVQEFQWGGLATVQ